jgi:hypothetical protein
MKRIILFNWLTAMFIMQGCETPTESLLEMVIESEHIDEAFGLMEDKMFSADEIASVIEFGELPIDR